MDMVCDCLENIGFYWFHPLYSMGICIDICAYIYRERYIDSRIREYINFMYVYVWINVNLRDWQLALFDVLWLNAVSVIVVCIIYDECYLKNCNLASVKTGQMLHKYNHGSDSHHRGIVDE